MRTFTDEERRRRLGLRHSLGKPAGTIESAVAGMVAFHSSDPVSVYLSAWARVPNLSVADVERTLYEDRSLIRILGMRRTLFVVPSQTAGVINAACAAEYVAPQRRRLVGYLEDQVVDGDANAWLDDVIERTMATLETRGEATARELVEEVPELGRKLVFSQGSFGLSTRVLFLLATAGRITRARPLGTFKSSQYRWTPMDRWVDGGLPSIDPEEARTRLAALWLEAFGPGRVADLKWWTGWTVGKTRAALEAAGAVEVELTSGPGIMLPDGTTEEPEEGEWVSFLPGLDPTVMGWRHRDWYLGPETGELFDRNGNAGPTVWWNGRVIGGWGQRPDGTVVYELVEYVPNAVKERLEETRERLTSWFDGEVIRTRFPTPMEQRLRI